MDPIIAAGLISGGASLLGNVSTNEANRRQAELAYQRELDMWNRNNEYNTPTNQMARLKSAGLNPNLVYGTGSVTGNTSGNLPKYQAPRMDYNLNVPNVMDMLGTYQDIKVKQKQQNLMDKQIERQTLENLFLSDTMIPRTNYENEKFWEKEYKNSMLAYQTTALQTLNGKSDTGTEYFRNLYNEALKGKQLDNQLKSKGLSKYSEEIQGLKISNDIRDIERGFMHAGGIRGTKDILPLIRLLLGK